jgi:hypothetical protein
MVAQQQAQIPFASDSLFSTQEAKQHAVPHPHAMQQGTNANAAPAVTRTKPPLILTSCQLPRIVFEAILACRLDGVLVVNNATANIVNSCFFMKSS